MSGATGAVDALEWLTDTLVPLPAAEYSAEDARGEVFAAIQGGLGGARFPACEGGVGYLRVLLCIRGCCTSLSCALSVPGAACCCVA